MLNKLNIDNFISKIKDNKYTTLKKIDCAAANDSFHYYNLLLSGLCSKLLSNEKINMYSSFEGTEYILYLESGNKMLKLALESSPDTEKYYETKNKYYVVQNMVHRIKIHGEMQLDSLFKNNLFLLFRNEEGSYIENIDCPECLHISYNNGFPDSLRYEGKLDTNNILGLFLTMFSEEITSFLL